MRRPPASPSPDLPPGLVRAALLVTGKDLRQRVRDRSAWILGVAAPLLLAAVLGQVVGGFTARAGEAPRIGFVDQESSPTSHALVGEALPAALSALDGEDPVRFDDRAEGLTALREEVVDALVVVPADLTARLGSADGAELEVVTRSQASIVGLVVGSIVDRWAQEVQVRRDAVLVAIADGVDPATAAAEVEALSAPPPVTAQEARGAVRVLDAATYVAAGLAVFFLFFTVQFGVLGLLEERRTGTLARLRMAPVPGGAVLLGKVATSIVVGGGSTLLLVAATTWLLGARWGPTLPVAVLVLAAVLAATSLVTVVATFADSPDAASNVQGVIAIVLGMLGGSFFPVATRPGLLATLSDLTPHGMFLTAVGDLQVPGAGLADIAPQLLGLLAFATAVAVGASGLATQRGLR